MSHRAWPLAVAVSAALAGCAAGYQDNGPVLHLHHDMTRDASLAALDPVARQVSADDGFVLRGACVLSWGEGAKAQSLSLLGQEGSMAKANSGERFKVLLSDSATPAGAPATTVLADAPWAEATQMKWLLDDMRHVCRGRSAEHAGLRVPRALHALSACNSMVACTTSSCTASAWRTA